MSKATIIVIFILFVIGVCFLFMRTSYLKKLNTALKDGDHETVQIYLNKPQARFLLSAYLRDLYQARVYYLSKNEHALYEQLRKMMKASYEEANEEQFLTIYYHTFVEQGKREFALEMLDRIHQCKDEKMIRYCDWTKTVLLDGVCDICAQIEASLDNKDYSGFPLGTCAYMIGISKKRLGMYEDAMLWLDAASDILQKRDVYRSSVIKEIDELHQMGYQSPEKQQRKKRR